MSAKAKKKSAKGGARQAGNPNEPRLAGHSRAQRSIQRAKSWAGLGAFLCAGYAQWKAGGVFVDVAVRALLWGVAAYVLVWALGVQVWRHLIIAEVRAAEKRWRAAKAEEEERIRKLTTVLQENGVPTSGTGMPSA